MQQKMMVVFNPNESIQDALGKANKKRSAVTVMLAEERKIFKRLPHPLSPLIINDYSN